MSSIRFKTCLSVIEGIYTFCNTFLLKGIVN
nr:MAG TPA: hypothetical protein [Caudoviricetes sp.]